MRSRLSPGAFRIGIHFILLDSFATLIFTNCNTCTFDITIIINALQNSFADSFSPNCNVAYLCNKNTKFICINV